MLQRPRLVNPVAAILALACTFCAAPVMAAPIIQEGSAYIVKVGGEGLTQIDYSGALFDGVADNRTIDGRNLSLTELQQDLGGGLWKVRVTLTSDVDLSPGVNIFASVGHGDALNLLQGVRLESALLQTAGFDPTGAAFSREDEGIHVLTENLRSPWIGEFPDPGVGFGLFGAGGYDFRSIGFEFTLRALPEPSSVALVGLALAGLAWRRRSARA